MPVENEVINTTTTYEKSIVSCILVNPDILESLNDLAEEDFLDTNCRKVFSIIKELESTGQPIDLVSVSMKDSSVTMFIADLMSFVGSASNYQYYADNVKKLSSLRKLGMIALSLQAKSMDTELDPEIIVGELHSATGDLFVSKSQQDKSSEQAVGEVMDGVRKLIENPMDVVGVTTGFPSLDEHLSGLHKSDLIILAARPARGKSSFALQLAKNVAMFGKTPTMFFSLEMATDQLVQRLLASVSKVELQKIRTGKLDQAEQQALGYAAEIMSAMPIYYNDNSSITIKQIRKSLKAHNAKHKEKIGFVVIDYLQLMAVGNGRDNMVQVVAEISRSLKILAKEFNVPILALSQLSRNVEHRGGRPRLADLRDSGAIEQDADIVCFLHSQDTQVNEFGMRDIDFIVEKHRNGATFEVPLSFDGAKMVFTEVDKSDQW